MNCVTNYQQTKIVNKQIEFNKKENNAIKYFPAAYSSWKL